MAAFNDKASDKLNNLPAAQRERKFYYIVISTLAGVILSLCGYIKYLDVNHNAENKELQAKIDACGEAKVLMERDFRAEIRSARNEILQQVLPVAEGREERGAQLEGQYNKIIPTQLEAREKHLQLIKELNKNRKP